MKSTPACANKKYIRMRLPALDFRICRSGHDVFEDPENASVVGRLQVEVLPSAARGHRDRDLLLQAVVQKTVDSG